MPSSLQKKIVTFTILPIILALTLGCIGFYQQSKNQIKNDLYSNSESIVRAISPDIMAIHLLKDQTVAAALGDRLKAFPHILQLSAYTLNSERIFLFEVQGYSALDAPKVDSPLNVTFQEGDRFVRFSVPIYTNGKKDGTAIIVHSLSPFEVNASNTLYQLLFVFCSAMGGVLLISLWFKRNIISPIELLAKSQTNVSQNNDFKNRVTVSSNTEIGILQLGFNTLMSTIQDYQNELHVSTKKLMINQEQFESILETSQEGVALANDKGHILFVNPSFMRILQLKERPKNIEDLAPAFMLFSKPQALENCLKNPALTLTSTNLKNPRLVIELKASESINNNDKVLVIRDISTESLANQFQVALKQAQKMEAVGRLAGGVAHDFNNLLTVIVALSFELSQGLEDDEQREDAEEIFRAAEMAAELTQKLLVFSRKQAVNVQLIDLNSVLSSTEGILNRLIGDQVSITFRLSKLPCWLEGDRAGLEQVIINLAVNARDAMTKGGRLNISVVSDNIQQNDPRLGTLSPGLMGILKVQDSGTGIDEETLAHIFEPFFTTKSEGRGTGLGLSTIYSIVNSMHGNIHVESTQGVGTTFSILLPLMTDIEFVPQEDSPLIQPDTVTTNYRILVVEDTEPVLRVVVSALKRAGYVTFVANDPLEALMLIEKNKEQIDLILTDVRMPHLTGPQLAVEVEKLLETPPPILFMSGQLDDMSKKDIPVDRLILKPFKSEDIIRKIEMIIRETNLAKASEEPE